MNGKEDGIRISKSFVDGFVKECYDNGLLEKEAAALLSGAVAASVEMQRAGMQKQALFANIGKGLGAFGDAALKGTTGLAKGIGKGLWWGATAPLQGGLKVALPAYTAGAGLGAYGLHKFNNHVMYDDDDHARALRRVFGDKGLFGGALADNPFENWSIFGGRGGGKFYNPIMLNGGGYGGSPTTGYAIEASNPFSGGPAGGGGGTAGPVTGGYSGGSPKMWTAGDEALRSYNMSNSKLQQAQQAELDLSRQIGATTDGVERTLLEEKRRAIAADIKKYQGEVDTLSARNDRSNQAYQAGLADQYAKARRDQAIAGRNVTEAVQNKNDKSLGGKALDFFGGIFNAGNTESRGNAYGEAKAQAEGLGRHIHDVSNATGINSGSYGR